MNEFWISFWSTFFSHLAVLAVIASLGFIVKGQVLSKLTKYIEKQVVSALFTIEETKEHHSKGQHNKPEDPSKTA